MKKITLTLAALTAAMSIGGCDQGAPVQEVTRATGKTMGTFYMVQTVGRYKEGEADLQRDSEAEFKTICDAISTFDPSAELARINENHTTEPIPVSDFLGRVISDCVKESRLIDGAMDISVGPLVNLWGFGKDKRLEREPDAQAIENARKLVGPDKFAVETAESGQMLLKKSDPDVRLDLATVGEGLGADAVAEMLGRAGVKNYLATVAGASRSAGLNPKGEPWKIGIEDPSTPDHKVFEAVCPLGMAMSTAGSYRNYFKDEQSGKIYSHAIDPKTGRPVDHATLSVTVIAPTAFETDALDTGLLVLGAEKAHAFAERSHMAIYTIEMKDGKPVGKPSSAFRKYLECKKD